ncbi:MAG TPA: PilN domain-containing protein [Polyangia bacterium]|nr:PilN domain-containing protein [Polyangia bacterium]
MIRINLLPIRKVKRAEASQRQFVYMGMAILATVVGVVFLHLQADGQLEDIKRRNTILTAEVARLKQEIGDYDKIRSQREELLRQRKTIQALDAGRTGPVYLLREMSEILSPGKGPTFDRVTYEETLRRDPNAGFNASWDPRRVWMEGYAEDQKHVRIRGSAKSNEDVAEFLKRLNSSVFFGNVNLDSTTQVSGRGIKFVNFGLSADVTY